MYQILTITPYLVDSDFLYTLRESYKQYPELFFSKLPKYCLTDNKYEHELEGTVKYTDRFHQFTGSLESLNKEFFYMFDAVSVDPMLSYEIDESGLPELFKYKNINFSQLFKILSGESQKTIEEKKNYCMTRKNIYDILLPKEFCGLNNPTKLGIPKVIHVILDLIYTGDYEDVDLNINLIGYLDSKLNIQKI